MNPFTDESRDARLAVNLDGICTKLRSPDSFHKLTMTVKPDHVSLADHMLACLLDNAIDTLKIRRDYRGIHSLLGTLYGLPGADQAEKVTVGTGGNGRH